MACNWRCILGNLIVCLFIVLNVVTKSESATTYLIDNYATSLGDAQMYGLWLDTTYKMFSGHKYSIQKFDGTNSAVIVAGTAAVTGFPPVEGGSATSGALVDVTSLVGGAVVSVNSFLYLCSAGQSMVRKVMLNSNIVTTIAGKNGVTDTVVNGDGGKATAAVLNYPLGIAWRATPGELFFSDSINGMANIRKVATDGIITSFMRRDGTNGDTGNSGAYSSATINNVRSMWFVGNDKLYFSTVGCQIRMVDFNSGNVNLIAGDNCASGGTGSVVRATSAGLTKNPVITADTNGVVYLMSSDYTVRKVADGIVTLIAGVVNGAGEPTPGMATASRITTVRAESGLVVDTAGNLFLGTTTAKAVRKLTLVTAPTASPTITPSARPSVTPTVVPSALPTTTPSVKPSCVPTVMPSAAPSATPSEQPTPSPTVTPSIVPTAVPSVEPTMDGTAFPSFTPTAAPSATPSVVPSAQPSVAPSAVPSASPSVVPTAEPSASPSANPSVKPSMTPSSEPSVTPSVTPSMEPSASPSVVPSVVPSAVPSVAPSSSPSETPTIQPSAIPSAAPSGSPSVEPSASQSPSMEPSQEPSITPTMEPSTVPSASPYVSPSVEPSMEPTVRPSQEPSVKPSRTPSVQPTVRPSRQPSAKPSLKPTSEPTVAFSSIQVGANVTIEDVHIEVSGGRRRLSRAGSMLLMEASDNAIVKTVAEALGLSEAAVSIESEHIVSSVTNVATVLVALKILAPSNVFPTFADVEQTFSDAVAFNALAEKVKTVAEDIGAYELYQISAVNIDALANEGAVDTSVSDMDGDDLTTGYFAGVVIGVIVAFLVLFALVYLYIAAGTGDKATISSVDAGTGTAGAVAQSNDLKV